MKVIKHLKHKSPDQRLKLFFKQMPLLTKVVIITISIVTFLHVILTSNDDSTYQTPKWYAILSAGSIIELILVIVIGLSDFNREQKKGSIYFLITYIFKCLFIGMVCYGIDSLFINVFKMQYMKELGTTSWPMIYLLSIAIRDMVCQPNARRYLFFEPFHIKALFYSICLVIILELISLRFDIAYIFLLTFLIKLIKIDNIVKWISKKIDSKLLSDKMVQKGILPTGISDLPISQIDRVVTHNSIVLEEK